jgi:hypothetical protein
METLEGLIYSCLAAALFIAIAFIVFLIRENKNRT